jgi:hypothetical protein
MYFVHLRIALHPEQATLVCVGVNEIAGGCVMLNVA